MRPGHRAKGDARSRRAAKVRVEPVRAADDHNISRLAVVARARDFCRPPGACLSRAAFVERAKKSARPRRLQQGPRFSRTSLIRGFDSGFLEFAETKRKADAPRQRGRAFDVPIVQLTLRASLQPADGREHKFQVNG